MTDFTAPDMAMSGFDLVLAALIVGTGLFAVTVRDLFGAVVFFIVYGVFIALAWLRLGAMDVALTEAALGAGLTGVLLIGAVARLARRTGKDGTDALSRDGVASALSVSSIAAMLVSAAISLALGRAFLSLSPPDGLRASVDENLDASGVSNPVTAVLINFRGWDTLLESIVLLAALIGLWSLWRDDDWGRRPGVRQHARANGVLATFGRLLPPFGLLLGVYLVWVGSSLPGGAFQGGTVLAAVWLLIMMAGLMPPPAVTSARMRAALLTGPAVFLGVGIIGAFTGSFLGLPPAYAKPLILMIEAALTLSIAATLALLVLGPPGRPDSPSGPGGGP